MTYKNDHRVKYGVVDSARQESDEWILEYSDGGFGNRSFLHIGGFYIEFNF